MIDQGANINAPLSHNDGFTDLQVAAAFRGNLEVVKFLLTLGEDTNSAPGRSDGKMVLEAYADYKLLSGQAELF